MKSYAPSRDLPPSFKTMADASEFLSTLRTRPVGEAGKLLLLQMFIPCPPSMLIEARWEDFDPTNNTWRFKRGGKPMSNDNNSTDSIIPLSKYAVEILKSKIYYDGSNPFLFPILQSMKKSERTTFMSDEIQRLWFRYFIDPDGFRYFFAHMAAESGYFQPKLVKSVVSGKFNEIPFSHLFVSHSLLHWWGLMLTTTEPSNRQFHPV